MKKAVLFMIICVNILMLSSVVNALFYYDIKMNYTYGEIKINSVNVIFSHYDIGENKYNNSESYFAKVDNKTYYFNVPTEQIYDILDNKTGLMVDGGMIKVNETEFNILIPYSGSGKEIIIYNNHEEILSKKSLIEFTRIYNKWEYDQLANPENYSNENFSEEITNENINEKTDFNYSIILISVLVIVLIGLILYYFSKLKKKK